MSRLRFVLLALLAVAVLAPSAASAQTRLLRFPDIHGDRVVFTYAGDLWTVPAAGGDARRLTAHPGLELFARFSPDGTSIAFTGQIDGDEQVYVMPAAGGEPRQLTYYPARGPLPPRWGWDHLVYGWSPDGSQVLFRSLRDGWDVGDGRLFTVSTAGGLPVALPMPTAGAGDFSPDGASVVYSPLARDFRSWKRYAGGWAQDLWTYDLASGATRQLTDDPRSDRDPMWIGDRIWFTSDRSGTLNLYELDPASGALSQKTHSTTWDVRWPSAGPDGRIVYELGGQLHVYDTASGADSALEIRVPSDLLAARPRQVDVSGQIQGIALSPAGQRALVVARGDVFTLGAETGPTRNLTHSSGAHDKHARWSPDGRWVAYVSDASGEDQLWLEAQDGSAAPRQLTRDLRAFLYAPEWSPDGKRIALSDQDGRIYAVTVADGSVVEVADDPQGQVGDYTWSPDGRWLAFSLGEITGFRSVWVWGVDDGGLRKVTDDGFNEFSPAWGRKGDYLYFLADRAFAPQIGSFEFNYAVDRETYPYALALRRDVADPFPPKSDEVEMAAAEDGGAMAESAGGGKKGAAQDAGSAKKGEEETAAGGAVLAPFEIDFDGLGRRVARVPVEADNWAGLAALDGRLLLLRGTAFYYGRDVGEKPAVVSFDLDEREPSELVSGFDDLALSADGTKLLVQRGDALTLRSTDPAQTEETAVPTGGLSTWVEPRQEWAQIFDEVWRRYRDFFYVENMHGYDWPALRERYRPLLADVGHRSDLNYVISEMIAELSISHAYITGGDYEIPPRPPVALPGARFELDPAAGRYRIAEIFRGDNAEPKYRAPLTEIGVDAAPGLYVLAVDGEELTGDDNPYRLLRFKADRPVTLTVNDTPSLDGARQVTYRPVGSEADLVYLAMVDRNRRRVDELSGGRLGYLHVPDMGSDGIYEWVKWFYPQIRKQGLVVDVRANGGGNVSQMLIERLQRTLLAVGYPRTGEQPYTYPGTVFHGPMAAILNETSASDGDIFPAMFKKAGLGPLIGKRSWGGVTGITNHGPLIDGGTIYVPEYGFLSPEGEWIVEGHGVDPDIEVDNDPASVLAGRDPQLERAVQEVLDRLDTVPHTLPPKPPGPVKTP